MKFSIEGKQYDFDGKMTVADAMFIFEKSGVGMTQFNQALLADGNPSVIAAWVYLLKRRAGEAVRWEDVLKLDIASYMPVPDEDEMQAARDRLDELGETLSKLEAKDATPNPTTPGGKTRKRATPRTS